MVRGTGLFLLPLLLAAAWARDKPDNWLEVRSTHFIVLSNASEKQARRITGQFERMRSVFHTAFPGLEIDPPSPVVVLAIKDEKGFRALEPPAYLAKGKVDLSGVFLRAPDKNYVLLRLDVGGEHPYSVVYHEYTHLLTSKLEWMPTWLSEGIAEFYQTTLIRDKDTLLGKPSTENLQLLGQNPLLPLATLFAVDSTSPYYQEENKGSIFYAQSWALTHYLMMKDRREHTHLLDHYEDLLSQKVDPFSAATQAFGDLNQLQAALERYVGQSSFNYVALPSSTQVDENAFQIHELSPSTADAVMADFLAYNQRTADAKTLLDQVLREDPNNVLAHETMGYIESRQGHSDAARKWYEQAVKLDSQSFLAHYYFAAMSMNGGPLDAEAEAQVESSLRAAIKLNPSFAPAFDLLAVFYGNRRKNLEEAHMLDLNAVQLEPGNLTYRLNTARTLLLLQRIPDAIAVMEAAKGLAKTPEQFDLLQNQMRAAEQYLAAQKRLAEERAENRQIEAPAAAETVPADKEADTPSIPRRKSATLHHPSRRTVTGTIRNVRCFVPAILELHIADEKEALTLHSDNYYKIEFSALNYTPTGELRPCADLEGMHAQIEFLQAAGKSGKNQIVSVELSK